MWSSLIERTAIISYHVIKMQQTTPIQYFRACRIRLTPLSRLHNLWQHLRYDKIDPYPSEDTFICQKISWNAQKCDETFGLLHHHYHDPCPDFTDYGILYASLCLYTWLYTKLSKTSFTWARFVWWYSHTRPNGQLIPVLHSLMYSRV